MNAQTVQISLDYSIDVRHVEVLSEVLRYNSQNQDVRNALSAVAQVIFRKATMQRESLDNSVLRSGLIMGARNVAEISPEGPAK